MAEAEPLRVLLLACATCALGLGVFALAGDAVGLWEPLKPAKADRPAPARRRAAAPARSPEPPVGARTAFLAAGVAAALALLLAAPRRLVRRARRPRLDAPVRPLPRAAPPLRSAIDTVSVRVPRHRRGDVAFFGLTVLVSGATGLVLTLLLR